MKNHEITDKETGKKYWVSRSIAILALVVVTDEPNGPKEEFIQQKHSENSVTCYAKYNADYVKNKYVLVNKRGSGCPNFSGYWNIPVGYLDYGETLKEACTRELMEEQGVYLDKSKWNMYLPIDDMVCVGDAVQNVTVRFIANITMDEYNEAIELGKTLKKKYKGEKNEVEERDLMLLTKENINSRNWAFNHRTLLEYQLEDPISIV